MGPMSETECTVSHIMVLSLHSKWAAGPAAAGREEGACLNRYVTDPAAAGPPPAHFQRNPPGRAQLAVFPRCSLDPYESDMGASLAP